MALSRLNYNSLNVTPTASKGIGFDSGADDLAATFAGGAMTFIKKLTSDGSDDDLTFVNGASDVVLDSTYKEYLFILNNIHPETDNRNLEFNGSDDTSSHSYDIVKTSATFESYHNEGGTDAAIGAPVRNQAQGTGFQEIAYSTGSDNDQHGSGYLHLFNPSSTTFVKHFIGMFNTAQANNYTNHFSLAGYFNTTAAITAIQFKFSSDEIQAGTISLYGIN